MKLRLLLLLALLTTFALQAQTPVIKWVRKNGPLGGKIIDIEVEPATGNLFLLDSDHKPYMSKNGGDSWKPLTFDDSDPDFNDIAITNGTIFLVGYDLYASVDHGATFLKRMTDVSPYSQAYRLKRKPTSGELVVLAYGAIYTSADNGQTWTLRNGTLADADQRYLEINSVDQIFILNRNATFETRPFRSTDGGATFSEASTGIPVGQQVLGLYGDKIGGKIYAVTSAGLYSSTNGVSWTDVRSIAIADPIICDYGDAQNSFIEFSADSLGMFFVDNVNHKLYSKTVDATNWELQATNFPSGTLSALCAAVVNYPTAASATAFFGSPSGVFKTTTGGASASQTNTGIASVEAEQILTDNIGDLFMRTASAGLLKSQDEGNNWAPVSNLSSSLKYFFTSKDHYYLFATTTDNMLQRSNDHGSSWSPLGSFMWAGAADDGKVFALQNSSSPLSLYYSSNNGSSWTTVAVTGLPASFNIYDNYDGTRIYCPSADKMFLYLYDYNVGAYAYYQIDFAYDAYANITAAAASKVTTIPIELNDISKIAAANGKIYIYQAYGTSSDRIAVSDNGGTSWTTYTVRASENFFVLDNGYIFLVDDNDTGKLYLSRNDGAAFVEAGVPDGVRLYDLRDITIDNSGFAYLAFNGDYLYETETTIVLPSAPTDLREIGNAANAVALDWQDLNEYDRDIVIERSVNGVDFITAGEADGWNTCYASGYRGYFVDTTVEPSTNYTYRIKAKNAAGSSAFSSTIAVSTPAGCAPDLPENASWTAINSGAEGYPLLGASKTVGIKHLGDGKYAISDLSIGLNGSSDPEPGTFYKSCGLTVVEDGDGGLRPNGTGTWDGTTLTLKWQACYEGKTETLSLTLNATDPVPGKPATPLAYVVSNSAIEVKWKAAYYEKSYVISRSVNPTSGYAPVATVEYPITNYIDNGPFVEGTTYYYKIAALNGNTVPDSSPSSDYASIPFNKPNFLVAENAITNFNTSATVGSIWADFNNDGLQDYLTMRYDAENDKAEPLIFKNLGTGDFEAFTVETGDSPYLFPSVADYDNDHYPDLALSANDARVLAIFKGNGDFTFSEVPAAQLGDLSALEKKVASTSWVDFNNDGLADLFVISAEDGSAALYKQNANHSFKKGFEADPSSGEPLLAIWADYDNDGYQDFLLGAQEGAGRLYHNNGDETFMLVTGNGFDAADFLAAAWGDYNNDGFVDLFCGVGSENVLYKNNGDGTFTKDVSTSISEPNYAVNASWGDYNNDGFLDLMTVCFIQTQSRLFLRDPLVTSSVAFKKVTTEKVNDFSLSHYSVANADPDQDGRLDLLMSAFIFDDEHDDALLPANNNFYENNNPVANWSEVKLNPSSGSTESLGATITLTAGGKSQTRQIAANSGFISRNSTIAHFGLGATTVITNIQIRWPDGSVQNYPLPPINQLLVIDQDVQGPAITSKSPVNNATGIEPNTTISLTLDENNFPVSGKQITLRKTGQTEVVTSVDVTTGTKTGNQYVFTLPVTLDGETEYTVLIEAGAFRDRYANPSAAIGPGEWRFTTKAVPDLTPPEVTFTPPASLAAQFGSVSPSITAKDDKGIGSVKVFIRKISGSSYVEVPAASGSAANTYTVTLSEDTHFDDTGAEFYITATDLAGNTTRKPDATGTYKVYLSYDAGQSAIPSSNLGIGGTANSWKVFSIPFELSTSNKEVTAIFDEFASLTNKTDYRLITLGGDKVWSEYPANFTTINRGSGYFINFKNNPGPIDLFDGLQAPGNSRSDLYHMNLKAGWNMIGNPYLSPISWDDVAERNNLSGTEAQLKTFSNGSYSNDQTLDKYEGGFVLMSAAKSIEIPFQGQGSGGRRGVPHLGEDMSAKAWMLPIIIRQAGLTYVLGGIGMAPDANLGIDNYDDVTPPRFIDYLEMNFPHPEHIARNFTREVVPSLENYTWEFTVDSNLDGAAELTWNNAPLLSSGKDLFLLDLSTQQLIDMKETGSHTFSARESSRFRIYYGDNLSIAPERVQLGKAWPNPTNGHTVIGFSLPETGGLNQSVSLQLMDAMGRPVQTIKQARLNPGYYETSFDAKGLVNGFYTYRLTVKNRKGQTTEVNKLIIK